MLFPIQTEKAEIIFSVDFKQLAKKRRVVCFLTALKIPLDKGRRLDLY